jgi:GNAT superfamily N-acetyltransferase
LRRATAEDIDVMNLNVQAGLDSYAEFAPSGWQPPQAASWRDRAVTMLNGPETWASLAVVDGQTVGHVSFFPGRERPGDPRSESDPLSRPVIPGLAHLWQLFIMPEWWGRGVAPMLHDEAVAEMRARGYEQGRLFTPSLQARARRFYERRGWSVVDEAFNDGFALMMCEYRIPLD